MSPPHGRPKEDSLPLGGKARSAKGAHHIPAVLLMGPTGSGKSALAMALAERFPVEIVSVDSAQVYRGMDVGTAKPDLAAQARVPHHLIDIIDPVDAYSAARFRADAIEAIAGIRSRDAVPLIVGGTMLYFKALQEGLSPLPSANPVVRAQLDGRAAAEGWPALHADLARVDPATAARLKSTDAQRIQRALEVYAITDKPLSELQGAREADCPLGRTIALALIPGDRARLHSELATRFDAMLAAGLVAELSRLRAHYALAPELPAMRCVGYRQAWDFLDARIDASTFREKGIAATRQLAKRQLTWLRAMESVARFDCLAADLGRRVHGHIAAGLAS